MRFFKAVKRGVKKILYTAYLRFGAYIKHSDAQHLSIFNWAVFKKIKELELTNSRFVVPSGATGDKNYSSCRDIMKVMSVAVQHPLLKTVLAEKSRELHITGNNARNLTINSTVVDNTIDGVYPILFSKTGSWAADWFNLAVVTQIADENVIGVIVGAKTNADRYAAMKELLDISLSVLHDSGDYYSDGGVKQSVAAIAGKMNDDGSCDILYEKNADIRYNPASLTKVMTALVAVDHIDDWNVKIQYKHLDMRCHTGEVAVGDILSAEDVLYDMLLPSSNQSAQALARFIGKKILEKHT